MSTASISLTDRQRRVLAEMGIDVWIRRGSAATFIVPEPAVRVAVERSSEPPARATMAPVAPARAEATAAPTELRVSLECIAAVGVVVVGEFANPLDLRLAQDIALAIAGATGKPQKAQFRWPQTQTGDSGVGAARSAYRGFLRGQIERANARLLLLLGPTAVSLLDQDAKLGPETLHLPDARALRADPNAKKDLWLNVSRRIPG